MTRLVVLADLHTGHRLGLLHPETVLDNPAPKGGTYIPELTTWQYELWDILEGKLDALTAGKRRKKTETIVLIGGDPTDGDKHAENNWTRFLTHQAKASSLCIIHVCRRVGAKRVIMLTGTPSHGFDSIAEALVATYIREEGIDVELCWHPDINLNGHHIDAAHHGPGRGQYVWTSGNVIRSYARNLLLSEVLSRRPVPAAVLRFHYHDLWRERVLVMAGGYEYSTEFVLCPALCGFNPHAQKVTRSKAELTVGLVTVDAEPAPEPLRVTAHTTTLDLREKVSL